MGIVDLPTLEYYFYGDICVCSIVRQAMTLKHEEYPNVNDEEHRPECTDDNYDTLHKARQI
jgi:hypothetical protein